jgi:hypothetical protein
MIIRRIYEEGLLLKDAGVAPLASS